MYGYLWTLWKDGCHQGMIRVQGAGVLGFTVEGLGACRAHVERSPNLPASGFSLISSNLTPQALLAVAGA